MEKQDIPTLQVRCCDLTGEEEALQFADGADFAILAST